MAAQGITIAQMMNGRANTGTGPVPTQTFAGINIAGGPIPKVGAAQTTPGTSLAGQFGTVQPTHIVIIVLALIAFGFLLHHLSFEESVRASA